jgi:uncharacterized protein YyaL (SSP411 family)
VPHFEKMLDDNALLLRVYAHHARLTGSPLSRRIARETGDFLLRELRTEGGAFAASLDADAGGMEGLTYRWPLDELVEILGGDGNPGGRAASDADGPPAGGAVSGDGTPAGAFTAADQGSGDIRRGDGAVRAALALLGVDPDRPDPEGEVLRLPRDPDDPEWFAAARARLLQVRDRRPQPGRDDIVVLRSNGLAITALAEAGAALDRRDWIEAAGAATDALIGLHRADGRWLRSSFRGAPGPGPATLADSACFAAGLLALYQATGDVTRLRLELARGGRGGGGRVQSGPLSRS